MLFPRPYFLKCFQWHESNQFCFQNSIDHLISKYFPCLLRLCHLPSKVGLRFGLKKKVLNFWFDWILSYSFKGYTTRTINSKEWNEMKVQITYFHFINLFDFLLFMPSIYQLTCTWLCVCFIDKRTPYSRNNWNWKSFLYQLLGKYLPNSIWLYLLCDCFQWYSIQVWPSLPNVANLFEFQTKYEWSIKLR